MGKWLCLVCLVFLFLTGCGNSVSAIPTDEDETGEEIQETISAPSLEGEEKQDGSSSELPSIEENVPSEDPVETSLTENQRWVKTLRDEGAIQVDLNQDGVEDSVTLEHVIKEGAYYISRFEISIGDGGSYILSEEESSVYDYDAELTQIELYDFDKDGTKEIILLFDARCMGGAGLSDIHVLWIDDNKQIEGKLLQYWVQLDGLQKDEYPMIFEGLNVDGVYGIQKVQYEGQERIQTHQYMYDYGHGDGKGDLVCIVTLDRDSDAFEAEAHWTVPEEEALYR